MTARYGALPLLVASLSKLVTIRRLCSRQPNMRSMILRCRYLGPSSNPGSPCSGTPVAFDSAHSSHTEPLHRFLWASNHRQRLLGRPRMQGIVASSRLCTKSADTNFGCSALALPSAICLSVLAHCRLFVSAFVIGAIAELSSRCSSGFTSSSSSEDQLIWMPE